MRSASGIKLLCIGLILGLFLPAARAVGPKPPRAEAVAIWTLRSLGLDQDLVRRVQKGLSRAFRRNPDWTLIAHKRLLARLGRAGLDQRSPLAKLAPAAGVRFLITGTLAGLGDEISLDFKVLDGRNGSEIRRVSISLPASGKGWPALFDELIVRLLSPGQWSGGLQLDVSEAGAQVLLDGKQIATTPLQEPVGDLVPGKHILIIRKDGFGEFSKFVAIRYKQVARLKVDLASATVVGLIYEEDKPAPVVAPPPTPAPARLPPAMAERKANWQQTVGWTCLGLGAAAAISGGFLAWHANDLERRVEDRIWTSEDEDLLTDRLHQGRVVTDWSERMFIGAGSMALLSGAFLLWGYLADGPSAAGDAAAADRGLSMILLPSLLPGGSALSWIGYF